MANGGSVQFDPVSDLGVRLTELHRVADLIRDAARTDSSVAVALHLLNGNIGAIRNDKTLLELQRGG